MLLILFNNLASFLFFSIFELSQSHFQASHYVLDLMRSAIRLTLIHRQFHYFMNTRRFYYTAFSLSREIDTEIGKQ